MNLVTLFVWMVDLGDCFIFNLPHYCFIEQFLVGMLYKVANGGCFGSLSLFCLYTSCLDQNNMGWIILLCLAWCLPECREGYLKFPFLASNHRSSQPV